MRCSVLSVVEIFTKEWALKELKGQVDLVVRVCRTCMLPIDVQWTWMGKCDVHVGRYVCWLKVENCAGCQASQFTPSQNVQSSDPFGTLKTLNDRGLTPFHVVSTTRLIASSFCLVVLLVSAHVLMWLWKLNYVVTSLLPSLIPG